MAAALRSVRRLKVLLVPRITAAPMRAESGGKGSPHRETSKTLVSFPVKVAHFQQPATGENRSDPLIPVTASLLDVGGSGGQSYREAQAGQEVSPATAQSVDGTSHHDSSSSSSSDSSSDSESEEENEAVTDLQAKGERPGGDKRSAPTTHKSSSGDKSLEKESPVSREEKDRTRRKDETSEGQRLHPAPFATSMTPPGAETMGAPDKTDLTDKASSKPDSGETETLSSSPVGVKASLPESGESVALSASEEIPAGGGDASPLESGETVVLSTSEEIPAGGGDSSPLKSEETIVLSTSEEIPAGGGDASSPWSGETTILSASASEEIPAGGVDTSPPGSGETTILSALASEETPAGTVETLAPETQFLSTATSEELPSEEEVVELHDSCSPPEPHAAPQEPFDNTKYQNLQHFTYTPFTFVDVDVDLAQFRLPQPTSGRPSPRH